LPEPGVCPRCEERLAYSPGLVDEFRKYGLNAVVCVKCRRVAIAGDTYPSGELRWMHASTVPSGNIPAAVKARAAELAAPRQAAESQQRAADDLNARVWDFINADSNDPRIATICFY
jgi:hypothetical protein